MRIHKLFKYNNISCQSDNFRYVFTIFERQLAQFRYCRMCVFIRAFMINLQRSNVALSITHGIGIKADIANVMMREWR